MPNFYNHGYRKAVLYTAKSGHLARMTPEPSVEKVHLLNSVWLSSKFGVRLDDISVLGGLDVVSPENLRVSDLIP